VLEILKTTKIKGKYFKVDRSSRGWFKTLIA
jgi:hypothetical protein